MEIKTYGVYGLTEWHGKVKAGTIEVKVSLVGGTSSPSGTQPAYMVTKDPVVQFVIENSKEFKSGFIRLVMKQELPGTHKRIAVHNPVAEDTARAVSASVENVPSITETTTAAAPEVTEEEAEGKTDEATTPTEVEFSTNQEAKDYLANTFGVKGALKTRAEIIAAGETYGVKITFVNN